MTWRSFRNGLLKVHLWVALVFCVPMVIIGISGSALLLQREILALSVPRAETLGARKPIPEIVVAAQAAAPAGMIAERVELPSRSGYPAAVRFAPPEPGSPERDIYVDPVSLRILGSEEVVERGPILAFLIGIHAFLAMPPPVGLPFVGWMGVAMIFMGMSGLILWWPRKGEWRRAFVMRKGARGFAFHFDLHRVVGVWGLLVLLAVSISGVYLTFPQVIGPFVRAHFPGEDTVISAPQPGFVQGAGPIGPEEAITSAEAAVPSARALRVQLGGPSSPHVVELEPQGLGPALPSIFVVLDPMTAEVSYIDDPRAYSLREKVLNWQYLLHFGIGLGWVWTVLVFLSGLFPLVFAITGITMWWKKRQARMATLREEAAALAE